MARLTELAILPEDEPTLAGIVAAFAWTSLLDSFRQLNQAKFMVLEEMEKSLPFQPFRKEREIYKSLERSAFSTIERRVPWAFLAFYLVVLVVPLMRPL
ncbi:MAG: hypothetical protein HQL41_02170 [Alphaproteobacteria bacterium]|nr:hypothetical protein [Alphaproteobacteria bacterium]